MSQNQPFLSLKHMRYGRLVMCRPHSTCFNIWKSFPVRLNAQQTLAPLVGCSFEILRVCELAHIAFRTLEVPHAGGRSGSCLALWLTDTGKIFTLFFLTRFQGWLTFWLDTSASHFANVCYSIFLSLFDPASPWIFDTKLKHYKPRDKFCPGCSPHRP